VRYVIDTNLRKILIERDIKGSIDFTKNMIRDLLQNKVCIDSFKLDSRSSSCRSRSIFRC